MTTLEDLYYGNINPNERSMKRDGRLDKLVKLVCRNEEALSETLTDKQKELLEKMKDSQNEMYGFLEMDAFIQGYILATRLMAEVFGTDIGGSIE